MNIILILLVLAAVAVLAGTSAAKSLRLEALERAHDLLESDVTELEEQVTQLREHFHGYTLTPAALDVLEGRSA
ncbi:hypothetical protein EAH68_12700 [Corynebacterium hylobatis]|uniref:Uncharacterized protein n=1 Tax=Corynebacterium hylobatis TaxID=1859290 RepID=A0A3R9ZYC3_9CORY|nr:hypothetical protein [Corynebacterium hylobatis]RSZ61518.1 hypothetical protein EAH68_12700 [Corynebacterium hylobatis]